MTAKPVLIASLSGRSLAASARRADYRPLVVDCFGDQDLASAPGDSRCLPAPTRVGFSRKALTEALSDLNQVSDGAAVGLVLGSGFEDQPSLIARLAGAYNLLGTDAETIAALKDPGIFFPLLDKLGILHPETRLTPPEVGTDWLRKRVGASGGLHIKLCKSSPKARRNTYFQKRISGTPISILAIVGAQGTAFAVSKQWLSPTPKTPFRYGGSVSHVTLATSQETAALEAALALTEACDVKGLISVDFIVNDDGVFCLEVNPRPGATLDIHDDDQGSLFEAHVIACTGGDPADYLQKNWRSARAKAAAYVYADKGPVTVEVGKWPDWAHDRPDFGHHIAAEQPVASAHADADTADAAENECLTRLAVLEKMLYDTKNGKERYQ